MQFATTFWKLSRRLILTLNKNNHIYLGQILHEVFHHSLQRWGLDSPVIDDEMIPHFSDFVDTGRWVSSLPPLLQSWPRFEWELSPGLPGLALSRWRCSLLQSSECAPQLWFSVSFFDDLAPWSFDPNHHWQCCGGSSGPLQMVKTADGSFFTWSIHDSKSWKN